MEHAVSFAALSSPLNYILPTLTCLFSTLNGRSKSYEGYHVIRADVSNGTAFNVINALYETGSLDFFVPPNKNAPADILVCPEQVRNLKNVFEFLRIPYDVVDVDIQTKIERERKSNEHEYRKDSGLTWTAYHRLSTIQGWMDSMAEQYPAIVKVESYGKSTEGRDMKVIRINTGGVGDKPAIWIDGGIHAREWISPAVVTYMANEIIQTAVRGDQSNFKVVDAFEWYIVPNMNPDGYEFSHTGDRMWRKTRSGNRNGPFAGLFGCVGVDPNRNFEYKWGGKGTSNNPCAQNYRGPKAASEPEIRTTQDYLYKNREQFKLFLTFHSYSQMLFTPWGYDNVPLEDKEDLMAIANAAVESLKAVHGTEYQAGSSPELLYAAAGGSEDYAKGTAGIKFSYCYELRDTGRYGFILPTDQIVPSGEETWAAVKTMAEEVMKFYKIGEESSS